MPPVISSRPISKKPLFSIVLQKVRILLIPPVTVAGCGTLFRKLRASDLKVSTHVQKPPMDLQRPTRYSVTFPVIASSNQRGLILFLLSQNTSQIYSLTRAHKHTRTHARTTWGECNGRLCPSVHSHAYFPNRLKAEINLYYFLRFNVYHAINTLHPACKND